MKQRTLPLPDEHVMDEKLLPKIDTKAVLV